MKMNSVCRIDGVDWRYRITVDPDVDQHWTDVQVVQGSQSYPRPAVFMPGDMDNLEQIRRLCFEDYQSLLEDRKQWKLKR